MTSKTTLLLAPAFASITTHDQSNAACTSSDWGNAIRDFARALHQNNWEVTVVVSIDSSAAPDRAGLARRLQPVEIGQNQLIVHEGMAGGGGIKLLAIAQPDGRSAPSPTETLRAALSLLDPPEIIQVWPKTQSALAWVESSPNPPKAVAHVFEARSGHPFVDDGLEYSELIILPSRPAAEHARNTRDSKLGPYAEKILGLAPGCDTHEWNPARDILLANRLDPPNLDSKLAAKIALRSELGLLDVDVPLVGVISPMTTLQRSVSHKIADLDLQIVAIDAGRNLESLVSRAPAKIVCPNPSSTQERRRLRHRIVAAADFILMPSTVSVTSQLFPCQYGTPIIARRQGEFAERLVNFDVRSLTGSAFLYEEDHELLSAIQKAISVWKTGETARAALIERCCHLDLSWDTMVLRLSERIESF